ncbi:MAG: hypothetical protein KGL74_12045 [Elusimicrobia bacterium]|nr:hypothetical protein [Elusimicrobiota bacterium]
MRRTAAIAAVLALLGACTSSGGGCGGDDAKKTDTGQSTAMSGSGGGKNGSLGEGVSFQGLGKKKPAATQMAAVPQAVLCGGFPNLPTDCLHDPAITAIKTKCCPTGNITICEGIPGGARLTGTGCTAAH